VKATVEIASIAISIQPMASNLFLFLTLFLLFSFLLKGANQRICNENLKWNPQIIRKPPLPERLLYTSDI
jgi:hypothetical protein